MCVTSQDLMAFFCHVFLFSQSLFFISDSKYLSVFKKKVNLASTNITTIQALSLEQHRWCKPKDSLKHSGSGTLVELSTEVFLAENIK